MIWLLLLLLSVHSVALAMDVAVTSRKLLTDRAWFSQVVQVPRRLADDSVACVAVSDSLLPGLNVEGYELVERSELLGVCKHQQTGDRMEIVPWSTITSDEDAEQPARVCPLPGAASASSSQRIPAPPLPPPESTIGNSPEGPVLEYQYVTEEAERIYVNAHYRLKKKFDAGSHGEVWRATRRRENGGQEEQFVLKRLFLELGPSMAQMGLREAHFGALLHGERHVTRFVEYFFRPARLAEGEDAESESRTTPELWLVFYDEGKSLRQYLYEKLEVVNGAENQRESGAGVVLQPSRFWEKLRTDARGENVLREILRQLLQALAALHARGITHRDIKPSNILVSIPPSTSGSATPMPLVKLADFGSAVDDYTLHNLYAASADEASTGPSQAEETREYQPPEVLFSDNGQPYDYSAPEAYDLWSVGVVFLEMVLGSPQVFLISPRERAKLDVVLDAQQRRHRYTHRRHDSESESGWRTKAYLLHVLTHEFCIFQPASRQLRSLWDKYALVSESCHFGRFNQTVVSRDPLKRGLEDSWGLDLMWRLLQWHPLQRITAEEALQHAYFRGPYVCKESGRQFATHKELRLHERYLEAQRARESIFASVVRAKYEIPDRFTCPHCGRVFSTAQSCEQHAHARRHDAQSSFCLFEAPLIVSAIRTESLSSYLPLLPMQQSTVGVALFQGRKKYMEDFVLILTEQQLHQRWKTERTGNESSESLGFDLYAVVDGHLGSAAASFVVKNLPSVLYNHFAAIPKTKEQSTDINTDPAVNVSAERKLAEKLALRQTFLELHEGFLQSLDETESVYDNNEQNSKTSAGTFANGTTVVGEYFSGCTLTVVLHFRRENRVVSANVGDSRALALLTIKSDKGDEEFATKIVPLSMDHWPNDPNERSRIESSGGFVNFSGLWRVVGQLAVSRSLGDRHLRKYVTTEPSVFHSLLSEYSSGGFLVVASDGLWETMTNADVMRFMTEKYSKVATPDGTSKLFNNIATDLLTEGYVRGSLDNMAVILVELS